MWNFRINNNGNTADDIRDRFVKAHVLAMQYEKALRDLHEVTNGRNYQTLPDGLMVQEMDVELLNGMLMSVVQMKDMLIGGASSAIRQRENLD
jgi:hypothetical protein